MYWGETSSETDRPMNYHAEQSSYSAGDTTAIGDYSTEWGVNTSYDGGYHTSRGSTYEGEYENSSSSRYENYQTSVTHNSTSENYLSTGTSGSYDSYSYDYGQSHQTPYDVDKSYYKHSSTPSYTTEDTNVHYHKNWESSYDGTYSTIPNSVSESDSYNNYNFQNVNNSSYNYNYEKYSSNNGGWNNYKQKKYNSGIVRKPRSQPLPPDLYYCATCKIKCACSHTYEAHLQGQKHKKKEAAAKAGTQPSKEGASLTCELCHVTCTGADAYSAHINGAKHERALIVSHNAGKPIPSTNPAVGGGNVNIGYSGNDSSSKPSWKSYDRTSNYERDEVNTSAYHKGQNKNYNSGYTSGRKYDNYKTQQNRRAKYDSRSRSDQGGESSFYGSTSSSNRRNRSVAPYDSVSYRKSRDFSNMRNQRFPQSIKPKVKDFPLIQEQEKIVPYYCNICKMDCGGPGSFKLHLKSERHREKADNFHTPLFVSGDLRCDLFETNFEGYDAYDKHMNGFEHQKLVKRWNATTSSSNCSNTGPLPVKKPFRRSYNSRSKNNSNNDEVNLKFG